MDSKKPISDTVKVTRDGAIVVDVSALLRKPHVKKMMADIRAKTVPRPAPPAVR